MKPLLAAILSLLGVALYGTEPIEFVGYVQTQAYTRFVLREVHSGGVSEWLTTGQSFRGYKVESYDPTGEILTVVSTNGRIKLSLIDPRPTAGRSAFPYDNPDMQPANRVTVTGAVKEQGSIKPHSATTVLDAIMAMGGFTSAAKITAITVSRPVTRVRDGETRRSLQLRFLDCSQAPNLSFQLLPGDSVFVPSLSSEK